MSSILVFDTAMSGISVGVLSPTGTIAQRVVETRRDQASLLVPLIQEVMDEVEVSFDQLDGVVTTKGPGSFTGLRIGLSTARIFSVSLKIPVIGINTLDLISAHYNVEAPYLIALETKRQDFYVCFYDEAGNPISKPFAANKDEILQRKPDTVKVIGGDCLERFKADERAKDDLVYLDQITQPNPGVFIRLAQAQFESLQGDMPERPKPLYLRGADVSVAKIPPRKLAQI